MKRFLPILLLSISLMAANAQPTITTAQLPIAGLAWTTANDTNYFASIPAGGANVTWDYTGLLNQYLDTLGFTSATGTPYAGSFPTSNLAAYDAPNLTWGYYTTNNSGFYQDGFVDANGSVFALNNGALFVPVPFTYGNTRTSSTGFTIDTSLSGTNLRITIAVTSDFLADGYGTLLLPNSSYSDVLRVKGTDLTTTTVAAEAFPGTGIYVNVSTSQSQTTSFRYYTQSQASFVLDIEADSLGTTSNSSSYLVQSVILSAPTAEAGAALSVSPNPADNFVTITITDSGVRSIALYSLDGRSFNLPLLGMGAEKRLDTGNLPEGLYFFKAGMSVGKFVVKH
ncbi:MAG: hypothetical protein ACKO1U_09140 [Bacteroidota bacterium]